ncbi:flagellar hook-length control protein FliK [Bradyrhizobium sp. WYCCWR 12699]|uniref:flagellar hook-length control protein FliK n=1 Tax=Bradyrhizobium sp. WYCCWR 12699 TaxID=3064203 RepID=UPI0028A40757|nr:flagellar hook-length control protein FliK [Bradyrhizobium sp. WYCCWR 12699]MDT4736387.1 flagellar hook-length control protein FliK [Bradyrhizobium sp. WYCCWR 12699]
MTKLNGTSGQLFSSLAESLNIRGSSRGTKSAGAKSQAGSSFNDLLHTVSNLAKQALKDDGSDTTAKAATLRPHLAHPTSKEKKDASVHELTVASERPEPTEDASDEKVDRLTEKHRPIDHAAKADVQDPSGTAVVVGQEIAAAPAVKPQMQSQAAEKDAPAREERSSTTKREVQGAGKAAAADTAPSNVTPAAARAQAAAPQAAAAPQSLPAQDSEPSGAMPATPGFEAVSANVERAAKAAGRDALPETTKVTVVQQETHLPPAQFNAPQQVANAVVTELKDSAGPAAPDLAASQTSAPDQPLKILTINLEPPALGNVTMRLRLVGTEVSIHLAAERRDTSQMLDQQRDQIRDLMQSAGYVADVAPVQHGSLDGFQSGSGQSQPQLPSQQQPSSQSQGTFDSGGTSSGQSDGGARQARQERQSNQETRHDQELGQPNRRGPVYL